MVAASALVERLAALPKLTAIPREQLAWLATRGSILRLDDGTAMRWRAEDPRGTMIVLKGRLSSRSDRGGAVRIVRELETGTITGHLPYSRLKTPSIYTVAVGEVELLLIDERHTLDMIRECHDFTALCVHEMVDRTRVFRSDDLHQEKMAALGRLSAGLAHELGNPSSAIARSARRLEAAQAELADAARALGAVSADGAAAAVDTLEAALGARDEPVPALELADREDELAAWLREHGVDDRYAYALATRKLALSDLERAGEALGSEALGTALRLLNARIEAGQLADEITGASRRVTSLVEAVKRHTHMDRAPTVESIALDEHLAGTLTLVGSKARARSIKLELTVEPDLPRVDGLVGDLNHVWINLVDNAIDAASEGGRVEVTAKVDRGWVLVEVTDDGHGIAAEDLTRIFEPFFTTKDVGEGAGLGLHVVRTIVEQHKGSVDATSEPGRTRLSVRLPVGARTEG